MYRYFIGQIFWNPEIIAKTSIDVDDFPLGEEREIFSAMKDINYVGEVINEMSVSKKTGISLSKIIEYKSTDILASQWRYYEKQIIEQSRQAKIRRAAEKILEGKLPADDMIALFSDSISSAKVRATNEVKTLAQCIDKSINEFEERKNRNDIPGIHTGFKKLDDIFGGFQKRRLYYVGARPSQGKSTLLMNFAMDCNKPCAFFTAESAEVEISNRMLIRKGRLDSKQFMNGVITEKDYNSLFEASQKLYDKKMHVYYEGGMPVYKLVSLAYEFKRLYNLEAIFIDYIQLLDPTDKKLQRNEQVAEISRRLKQLAVALDLPVICAAQLRRDAEGNKPRL
jgi:replicative DNA helicase